MSRNSHRYSKLIIPDPDDGEVTVVIVPVILLQR